MSLRCGENLKAVSINIIIVFKYFKSCVKEENLGMLSMEVVPEGVRTEVNSYTIKTF